MLSEDEIRSLSKEMRRVLSDVRGLEFLRPVEEIEEKISSVLSQNMQEEIKLNAECDKIMDQYAGQIERGDADPHKLFSMIKRKLAREKGVVL
ncbi:MAG: hypothetical protein COT35_04840 [Nitrospirae bacterium CG08_land_8_20_14_0_20_52_24]|nr:MAG: hypothetical protein AUK29_01430 [Nitrospirae bacterium CG2_30_53_67]PIS37667.1 MAG: hypothetical protein COT35_04840 [Nitrospirae bacterium CG08_land_8_20_14_0_20_52_24]PIV85808.1 MAG: hypothetical protein COW52_00275 [Nitrospirae bacterium CG17_big_fil_post_rev_8_21_14_2_50_50_9]PIW84189.1 MAG: hypothetical protein COZ95_11110 [Nitrospirae bacterium CG_4_8_14_3_um_filter_50_41]PIX86489.1 MAG: hypothetical protein COZ32_03065 [Nitrospirae bacterium CG_4_10_14_3_um_filter_53_41]